MRIQHNVMAMNAYRNYSNNTSALSKNLERLSSGYKINRAGDDAAGLAISEKMRAQITGLEAAQKNVKDGISLVNTAEGAMQEIQDMLNRMVYLATQSSNGTYDNEVDRLNLQKEVDSLKEEINRIADSANFNGIKLLDGSQATTGAAAAKSVSITGNVSSTTSGGTAGIFKTNVLVDAKKLTGQAVMLEGDTYEYGVSLNDGTSYTVKLTASKSDGSKVVDQLVAEDGTVYSATKKKDATLGDGLLPTVGELDSAVLAELNKSGLGDQYKITSDGAGAAGAFTFTAKEKGTSVPAVVSADIAATVASTGVRYGDNAQGKITVQVDKSALDAGREIDAASIQLYDGTNYDDAVFEINGHKFVMLTYQDDAKSTDFMNATKGLGDDVTILVADSVTKNGLKSADANFNQNLAKIREVTGLNVTDAVDETAYGAAAKSGVDAGNGIRLSAGKDTRAGGLMLQIGDTSDDFNQLRVGIGDMHVKALGIEDINIGTQKGASEAIDKIKKAINTVSAVRGDLGAISNRLDHTANNLSVMRENITDAESAIRDTDIAEEMMSYTKNNILVQSAQAMLAQANQVPQGVLQLLQ